MEGKTIAFKLANLLTKMPKKFISDQPRRQGFIIANKKESNSEGEIWAYDDDDWYITRV